MNEKENIERELKELAPTLALSQKKQDGYILPEGYFTTLDESIHERLAQKEYGVPENYFETLADRVLEKEQETVKETATQIGRKTRVIPWRTMSAVAASLLFLMVYLSQDQLTTEAEIETELTDQEINYLEENLNELELEELYALNEDIDYTDIEDQLIDQYIEENIYELDDNFLTELIE